MIKPKLIHYHFKLGKVESVVKAKHGRTAGPFKAGMDWPFPYRFVVLLQSEISKFSL